MFDKEKYSSQKSRILSLLRERAGEWVPQQEFLRMYISRAGAGIHTLRDEGWFILGRRQHDSMCYEFMLPIEYANEPSDHRVVPRLANRPASPNMKTSQCPNCGHEWEERDNGFSTTAIS